MKSSFFQVILLVVFGFAALVGLFIFATYSSTGSGKTGVGAVVIWGTLPKSDVQTALSVITKTQSTLKDVSYVEKDPASLPTELATAIATGNAPDLVLASQEQLLALARFIAPIPSSTLSARTFNNTFIEGGTIFAAPNGYYGIPLLVDPLALFANRPILASSGIPKPPATWEAVSGLVPHVALFTPDRRINRGLIGLGTYDNVHDSRGILSTIFLQTNVPIVGTSDTGGLKPDLGLSGNDQPGKAVLGFYTQFADPSKVSYTWNASLPDSQKAFLSGEAALYLGYVSEARFLRQANPNLDFDVAAMPQPGTAGTKNVYGLIYALMLPHGAKNVNGAYQAAALISNSGSQAFADATGLAPATLTDLSTTPADPVAELAYSEALYTHGWLSPVPQNTDAIFSGMINGVISGRVTSDTALTSAEASLGSALPQ